MMMAAGSFSRWLKFNLVGAIGIVVQLGALGILIRVLQLHYLPATALAVEAAVLHNFIWHERFTWADRASVTRAEALRRLIRFNLTTGAVSILGNLLLMRLFVGVAHLPTLASNLASIAACSLLNFLLSDLVVFCEQKGRTPKGQFDYSCSSSEAKAVPGLLQPEKVEGHGFQPCRDRPQVNPAFRP